MNYQVLSAVGFIAFVLGLLFGQGWVVLVGCIALGGAMLSHILEGK